MVIHQLYKVKQLLCVEPRCETYNNHYYVQQRSSATTHSKGKSLTEHAVIQYLLRLLRAWSIAEPRLLYSSSEYIA